MADSTTTNDNVLRLALALDGGVWYAQGGEAPVCSRLGWKDFLGSEVLRNHERVRLVGTRGVASLTLGLYEKKINEELVSLEICAPVRCPDASCRGDPEQALHAVAAWEGPSSLGGWRTLGQAELLMYCLIQAQDCDDQGQAKHLLRRHPLWPALSFILPLDQAAVIRTLTRIVDPRHYVDFAHPDRPSRLYSYLGLSPRVFTSLLSDTPHRDAAHDAAWDVLMVWKSPLLVPQGIEHPRRFLARYWLGCSGESRSVSSGGKDWKACLRTSQRFVSYLRQTWLDAIYPMPNPWREPLFDPGLFFRGEPKTAEAYIEHVRQFSGAR